VKGFTLLFLNVKGEFSAEIGFLGISIAGLAVTALLFTTFSFNFSVGT